jgi:septum site-determining protein MinC
MEPTQLRIANALARAPEKQVTQFYPEVAYIIKETIRITKTSELSRLQLSNPNLSDLG